jgi:hypothetical protein
MSARELADHVAQGHAGYSLNAICLCGEVFAKHLLLAHEKVNLLLRLPILRFQTNIGQICPVLNNNPNPMSTSTQVKPETPEPSRKRALSEMDQPSANEPRKLQARKPSPEPGDSITLWSNHAVREVTSDSESTCSDEPQAKGEPRPKKLPLNPVLRTLELTRMEAARKNAEKQQQYAQLRGERRQQRLARQGKDEESKAEEKEEKSADHDAKGKQKVELSIKAEQKLLTLPENGQLTQAAEDKQLQEPQSGLELLPVPESGLQTESELQTEPEQEDTHTRTDDNDNEHQPVRTPQIERFHDFFNRLLSLVTTLDTAIDVLSPAMLHQLADEIDNDWAVQEMEQMVQGAIAHCRRMNYDRWDRGRGKWNQGSAQARNYERPDNGEHGEQVGNDAEHEDQMANDSEQHGEPMGTDAELSMEE